MKKCTKIYEGLYHCCFISLLIIVVSFSINASAGTQSQSLVSSDSELYLTLNFSFSPGQSDRKRSLSWSIDYLAKDLKPPFAWQLSYYNEGHFSNHHRDGLALLGFLYSKPLLQNTIVFSAGLGPYFYFDTHIYADHYADVHHLAVLYRIAGTYYRFSPVLLKLGVDHIQVMNRDPDTTALVFSIGYALAASKQACKNVSEKPVLDNQISVLLGQTTVNSAHDEQSFANSVEYRYAFFHYIDGTLAWLNEGHNAVMRRYGILPQLWLERDFLQQRLYLGLGVGPYLVRTHVYGYGSDLPRSFDTIHAVVSLNAQYFFAHRWFVNALWHRILTRQNRDSDVFLFGLGLKF